MNEQYCNQCENRCSVDALHCNRGRAYFGQEMTGRNVCRRGQKSIITDITDRRWQLYYIKRVTIDEPGTRKWISGTI